MQQPGDVRTRRSRVSAVDGRGTASGSAGRAFASAVDIARFWTKVDRSAGAAACWPWSGTLNPKGYGQFRHAGQMRQAHRWILGVMRGQPLRWDDDVREEACHHCDNRRCCNPTHLYVGDRVTNMTDCSVRGRNQQARKTHCPQGHEYTEANTYRHPVNGRQCRTCHRVRVEARRRAAGGLSREERVVTHCPRGHEYTEANTYRHGKHRYCRACNRDSAARRRMARQE